MIVKAGPRDQAELASMSERMAAQAQRSFELWDPVARHLLIGAVMTQNAHDMECIRALLAGASGWSMSACSFPCISITPVLALQEFQMLEPLETGIRDNAMALT